MAKNKKQRVRKSTQVPGQFYGYSIQVTRMLAYLLRCRTGQAASLEVLGDVGLEGYGGSVTEEAKSGLAHNPIADRSVDIWKTLHNWLEAIRAGALGSDVRFVLYVAQPHQGELVRKLHETNGAANALALIQEIRDEFWGEGPQFDKKQQLPETIAPYVNSVLETSDEILVRLILSFSVESGSGSPADDLRPALQEKAISEGAVEDVLRYLLGWVKETVDRLIAQGRPAIITWDEFNKKLVAAAKKFDRSADLAPTKLEITEKEVREELRKRIYIRQLQLIESEERDLVRAVGDYLRAAADRTSWSERGDVLEPSFQEFADKLQRHWENRKRLAEIELAGRKELDIGRAVCAKCMELQIQLQGMEIPAYFTPGSYHSLAEGLKVGWHPRFNALLSIVEPSGHDVASAPNPVSRKKSGGT